MAKRKSLSDQLLELTTAKPKEIDPENELDYSATWRKGGDYDEPADTKPEVPQTRVVGKSLRDIGNLGSKYSGKRTSRKDLEQKQDEPEEEAFSSSDDEASKRFTGVFDEEGEKMVKAYGKKYDKLLKELEIDDEDEDEDEEGVDNEEEEDEEEVVDEESEEDNEERSDDDEEEEEEQSEEQIKSAVLDEADKLMQQLQQEEEEQDRETLQTSLKVLTKKEDTEKAANTKNQRVLWDSFLDVRIRLQKGIAAANRLPQSGMLDEFKNSDPKIAKSANLVVNQITGLLHKLQDLKETLVEKNEEMRDVSDSMQNISKKRKLDEQMTVEEWWDVISESDQCLKTYEEENIDRWYKRSLLASGNAILEKKFKAVNQSIMTQVNHVLNDSAKLRKKSQLKRTAFTVLGKQKPATKAKGETHNIHLNDYDEEIYDDTDFYQQILKELIETTTTDNDSMHVTQYWLENQHLKRKMKKAVERSASKGRKLKYEVHDKLVGFMAPKNDTTLETLAWRPQELYANLFGGQNKELR